MNKYVPIIFSVILFLMVVFPWQALAVNITQTKAAIGESCQATGDNSTAMGLSTKAIGLVSTAMGNGSFAQGNYSTSMGFGTFASGVASTAMGNYAIASGGSSTATGYDTEAGGAVSTAMGASTKAGGDYSFAAGKHMQLTADAHHTFVWGYSEYDEQELSEPNAFLIFPAGTAGHVGIGTPSPVERLHIRERSATLGAAILLDSTGGTGGRQYYVGSTLSSNIGGAGLFQIYDDTANQARFNINSVGNVGIGTASPDYTLEVAGNAAKSSGGTTWINSSDERLKDITGEYNRGLDAIMNLRPVTFFYKDSNPRGLPTEEENIGFIAQEVRKVFPEAVSEGADGYLDFNMHPVNVALVNAVKELKAENDALRQEIKQIKAALGL